MFSITNPHIADYIRETVQQPPWLQMIEERARAESVPVVPVETGQFLAFLVSLHRPRRILEIGTAVGYSTLWMAQAAPPACHIVTIEQDEARGAQALANFAQGKMADKIHLIVDDARNVLPYLDGQTFDLLFMDAAKGQYRNFLAQSLSLLNDRALIISDNVLFHGTFFREKLPRRSRTMVRRLQEYIDWIHQHPQLQTVLLPLGDGLAVSLYNKQVRTR
ncbi:MAG TPA: O-methyltransferase [Firmicutes bacterium]|nr:O-methyltransferase [Bacillota bacterium]